MTDLSSVREEFDVGGVRLPRPFKLLRLGHFGVNVMDVEAAREFYQGQFELTLLGRDADGSVRLSDGTITIKLTGEQSRAKSGIQYFGIQVARFASVKDSLRTAGVEFAEGSAGQIKIRDPEGNQVVVSEQGWTN